MYNSLDEHSSILDTKLDFLRKLQLDNNSLTAIFPNKNSLILSKKGFNLLYKLMKNEFYELEVDKPLSIRNIKNISKLSILPYYIPESRVHIYTMCTTLRGFCLFTDNYCLND